MTFTLATDTEIRHLYELIQSAYDDCEVWSDDEETVIEFDEEDFEEQLEFILGGAYNRGLLTDSEFDFFLDNWGTIYE